MTYAPFYKVIVVKVDVFESIIIDERHFATRTEADVFADTMQQAGYMAILVAM